MGGSPGDLKPFAAVANLATRRGVEGHELRIHAPLIELSKAEIIARGMALGVDYLRTRSWWSFRSGGRHSATTWTTTAAIPIAGSVVDESRHGA